MNHARVLLQIWLSALVILAGCSGGGNAGQDDVSLPDAWASDISDAGGDTDTRDIAADTSTVCGEACGEMVLIPAATFLMGCNESADDECFGNEKPAHMVTVPDFKIDLTEVTVQAYGLCVDAGVCTAPIRSGVCNWGEAGRTDHPINCVSWYEARQYCAWAGRRLCSEAEWEKASRGTDGRIFPWGNQQPDCDLAVMNTNSGTGCGEDTTWPVGSLPEGASPYGILDMAGNVWEWIEDDAHDDYDNAPDDGSAWVDEPRGTERIQKGGGFNDWGTRMYCMRASARSTEKPDDSHETYDYIGIRCCK